MRTSCVKNGLVFGVIVLFIGVGIQPAYAEVSIESDNSELVKITVQFYETDRTYNYTVMLTQEQITELESLLYDFNNELESVDNPVETETIFENTVVSLDYLGLLPDYMSLEEAQRLVTGKEQDPRIIRILERWISKNQKSLGSDENTLCLIAGDTTETYSQGPIGRLAIGILSIGLFYEFYSQFENLNMLILFLMLGFFISGLIVWNLNPLQLGYEIGLGYRWESPIGPEWTPAKGSIYTKGSNGIKLWNGKLYGDLPFENFFGGLGLCYPGVFGFTGIKIFGNYLGFALWVKIRNA